MQAIYKIFAFCVFGSKQGLRVILFVNLCLLISYAQQSESENGECQEENIRGTYVNCLIDVNFIS